MAAAGVLTFMGLVKLLTGVSMFKKKRGDGIAIKWRKEATEASYTGAEEENLTLEWKW